MCFKNYEAGGGLILQPSFCDNYEPSKSATLRKEPEISAPRLTFLKLLLIHFL